MQDRSFDTGFETPNSRPKRTLRAPDFYGNFAPPPEPREHRGFTARGSHSKVTAAQFRTRNKAALALSPNAPSPSQQYRDAVSDIGYRDISQLTVTKRSINGSPLTANTNTPQQRPMVRSFKIVIKTIDPKTKKVTEIEGTFFQTAESAAALKIPSPTFTEEKIKKIRETIKPPASAYYQIPPTQITSKDFGGAGKRKVSYPSLPTNAIYEAFKDVVKDQQTEFPIDAAEQSHYQAHYMNGSNNPAFPVGQVTHPPEDGQISGVAPRSHNSMRIFTIEHPFFRCYIERDGMLFYSDDIQYFRDLKGEITPLLEKEVAKFTDREGNSIEIHFSVWNGVTPAQEIGAGIAAIGELTFNQTLEAEGAGAGAGSGAGAAHNNILPPAAISCLPLEALPPLPDEPEPFSRKKTRHRRKDSDVGMTPLQLLPNSPAFFRGESSKKRQSRDEDNLENDKDNQKRDNKRRKME